MWPKIAMEGKELPQKYDTGLVKNLNETSKMFVKNLNETSKCLLRNRGVT